MARSSSANLALTIGSWVTKVKLFRVETGADTPSELLTHTCRSELSMVGKCSACGEVIRVTGVQKSGPAKGKAATEPKDIICPHCKATDTQQDVHFCGTCDKVVPEDEIEHRLSLGGHTVRVDEAQLLAWQKLLPEAGTMRVASVVLRNTLGTYLFDEAYQVVPDKGSVTSLSTWMDYLNAKRAALIVHFAIKKNFKVAALYVTVVRGTPVLILHTLLGYDEIALEPFELPEVTSDLRERIHQLLQPAWTTPLEAAADHPQRRAFTNIFTQAEAGNELEIPMMGALPGELDALSKQLSERLEPPKKKGARKGSEDVEAISVE